MKKVIDIYGRNLMVDDSSKKMCSYSNAEKRIVYNARIIENGKPTLFFTDYVESGTVESIEDRIKGCWNSRLYLVYASAVGFDSSANDPDHAVWSKFVAYVKENESRFFTKKGDLKRRLVISEEEIARYLRSDD